MSLAEAELSEVAFVISVARAGIEEDDETLRSIAEQEAGSESGGISLAIRLLGEILRRLG